MADPFGFLKYPRKENPYRPVAERITDWQELQEPLPASERQEQAARTSSKMYELWHSFLSYRFFLWWATDSIWMPQR